MSKKWSWVNGTLIGLNIVYFLYLEIAGSSEDTLFMVRHGAMYAPLVLKEKEYYRLLTAVFMHFGIICWCSLFWVTIWNGHWEK